MKKKQKILKLDQKNNQPVVKFVFVARCDIHLDICPKILSLKWPKFGLITVGSSKTLFYAMQLSLPYKQKVCRNPQDGASRNAELKSHSLFSANT